MVSTFKARIPTRRGRRTRARGGFHAYGKPADKAPGRERVRRDRGNLNQYTVVGDFEPEFDADGNAADGCKADWTHAQRAPRRGEGAMGRARINQTKVQTSTGIWNVMYNAENRPTVFSRENAYGSITRVTCAYDYMGRRATKKVETITTDVETEESAASTTLNQRYLYRGYLQVACCDLTRSAHPCLWLITWDPTQQTATRPLAIQKDATWYAYGWDLTKNICEVFGSDGYIKTVYSYAPYGAVTASGSVTQPIQWSSEFYDDELGLAYYNYRYYEPTNGRWLGRDLYTERVDANIYQYVNNQVLSYSDVLGLRPDDYGNPYPIDLRLVAQERRKKEQEILNFIQSNATPSYPYCWKTKECVTLTLLIDIPDPAGSVLKKKIGHASMAIGQEFMDYGPLKDSNPIWGSGGRYWADPENKNWHGQNVGSTITLDTVKDNLGLLVQTNAVVEIIGCVCASKADAIRSEWQAMLASHPGYSLFGKQCASSIVETIKLESIGTFMLTPEGLYEDFIKSFKMECSGYTGKPPHARLIKHFGN